MSDESMLSQKAREAILVGKLPGRRPNRMWGGPGGGQCCKICDQPVERDKLGYELEFVDEDDPERATCHVHVRCLAAWESVCRDFEAAGETIFANEAMVDRVLPKAGDHGKIASGERDTTSDRETL